MFAHKLNIFTEYENGKLYISSYFANGNGCQNCKVTIKDENENILKEEFTNKDGELITSVSNSKLKIIVDAKAGHIVSKDIVLKLDDIKKEENQDLKKLKEENQKLKAKIKSLEQRLQFFDILKSLLAVLAIFLIFYLLKRFKK